MKPPDKPFCQACGQKKVPRQYTPPRYCGQTGEERFEWVCPEDPCHDGCHHRWWGNASEEEREAISPAQRVGGNGRFGGVSHRCSAQTARNGTGVITAAYKRNAT